MLDPPHVPAHGRDSVAPSGTAQVRVVLQQPVAQYVVVLAVIGLATLLRIPFESLIQGRAPYGLYFPVLVATAWFYGVGPTVFAAALALFAAWYMFLPPAFSFAIAEPSDRASIAVYVVSATALIALSRVAARARRTLEATLRDAAHYVAVVRCSDDAIVSMDLDGSIVSWNAAAERLYGYTESQIVGRNISLLIPPELDAGDDQVLRRARRGEALDHFETERVGKDGRRIEVSLTASPIRDAHGKVVGVSKIARDITERRQAERALVEQREWFRITLSSIGDAVITTDRRLGVTYLNRVAEQLTGWSESEARGQPLDRVLHLVREGSGARIQSLGERALERGEFVGATGPTSLISKAGRETPIESGAAPIVDARQVTIGVVLVFHDVSDRRMVEVERQRVAQQREGLLESERAARAEAERASRLKDEFLATVSHELRTPLNAVLGWAQLLVQGPSDTATMQRGLAVIERNARLQAQLIADLLDVSSIVSGKIRLDLQRVELADVVRDAIETVRGSAEQKGVSIVCTAQQGLRPITGDASRLQQVVWNLLANAVKFSPPGGRVQVELGLHDDRQRVSVRDEGVGIAADFIAHLFDRFRQADASVTRRFGGLGLGLTIAQQLIELHGGSVHAHSEGEGSGATFVIELPDVPDMHLGDGAQGSRALSEPADDRARLAGLRVLVVDDESDARELAERLLTEAGCRVTAVDSAATCDRALQRERPDLLLSDISMPDEDGYALMRRIRAREAGQPRLPAIALTAFARDEDSAAALDAGFDAHLAKPVNPGRLFAAIVALLEASRTAREPAPMHAAGPPRP